MLLGGQKRLWVLLSTYTTLIYCIMLACLSLLLVMVSSIALSVSLRWYVLKQASVIPSQLSPVCIEWPMGFPNKSL